MVAAAQRRGPPPPILELGWACERWQALPEDGGYMDQHYRTMKEMHTALNVYQAVHGWENVYVGKNIHTMPEQTRAIIGWLRREGMI